MNRGVDIRLAAPVALGWATLGILQATRPDAVVVAIVLAAASVLLLALAAVLPGSRRGIVLLLATGLAVSALLSVRWAQEPPPPAEDPGRCAVVFRLDSGNAPPTGITVQQADCRDSRPSGPAVLLAPEDEAFDAAALGFGTVMRGDCRTWLFNGAWMLDCERLEVISRPLHARLSADWRAAFAVANEPLPGDGGALLAGLAIGDTSRVDDSLEEAMLDAGLSHLTAVSGSNCAIVTASAFALATALGARRWLRIVTALAALGAFVVLVTPEPSVTRASLMAVIALFGLLRGQPRSAVPLLALAVLVGLLVHPQLATSVGFVLSVLATAGLIVHSLPLSGVLERWMPRPLAVAVAVPAAAQLWCLPALIVLDNGVQPLSVLWNMAAAPAAPIVTIVGLVACLAAQAVPVIGTAVAWFAWPAAAWIAAIARLSDALPPWRVPWADGAAGAVFAAVALLGITLVLRRRPGGGAIIALAAAAATSLVIVPAQVVRGQLADWAVVQCDVEQGHATLVRVGEAVVLIDTGEHDDLLAECLDLTGIGHIDVLVLSHFDSDHSGSAASLTGRVGILVHGPPDDVDVALIDQLTASGAQAHDLRQGASINIGDARIDALWPPPESAPGNAASLVLRITQPGAPSLLIMGDTGQREHRRMLSAIESTDIVLAAHHCSADQEPGIYRQAQPDAVLVGVGENSYGHPTADCLEAISAAGATALRTDDLGTIAIMRDGTVWTSRAP